MNKKTRNVLSGILVGIASVFAVINFADIPADEVGSFILATLLFFTGIVILALLAVTVFKLLAWAKNRLVREDDAPWTGPEGTQADQDDSGDDRS